MFVENLQWDGFLGIIPRPKLPSVPLSSDRLGKDRNNRSASRIYQAPLIYTRLKKKETEIIRVWFAVWCYWLCFLALVSRLHFYSHFTPDKRYQTLDKQTRSIHYKNIKYHQHVLYLPSSVFYIAFQQTKYKSHFCAWVGRKSGFHFQKDFLLFLH